jgi:hypothetical protein
MPDVSCVLHHIRNHRQQRVASNQRDPLSGRYLVLNIPRTEIGRCDPETAARLANAQGLGMR